MTTESAVQPDIEPDWKRALVEYGHVWKEIRRLEETGKCSCEEFHTCSICAKIASLNQQLTLLINLWGDTWAVLLLELLNDLTTIATTQVAEAELPQ